MYERERPLHSDAMQLLTELFKFMEKVPPFSATILCKESSEWVGGTLTKSIAVKEEKTLHKTLKKSKGAKVI